MPLSEPQPIKDWQKLAAHYLADLFPLLDDTDLAKLAASVRAHGVREPIVFYHGQILDGRNRHRAALVAMAGGLVVPAPLFREFSGTEDEALALVLDLNLHRRHLTESQRAMVADKLASMQQGARTDLASIEAKSQAEAAALLKVSRSSAQRARQVRRETAPEVVHAVETGELPLGAALEFTHVPKEQQPEALERARERSKDGKIHGADVKREIDWDGIRAPAERRAPKAAKNGNARKHSLHDTPDRPDQERFANDPRVAGQQIARFFDREGELATFVAAMLEERPAAFPEVIPAVIPPGREEGPLTPEQPPEPAALPEHYPLLGDYRPGDGATEAVWERWATTRARSLEERLGPRAVCWLAWAIVNDERSNPQTRGRIRSLARNNGVKPRGREQPPPVEGGSLDHYRRLFREAAVQQAAAKDPPEGG